MIPVTGARRTVEELRTRLSETTIAATIPLLGGLPHAARQGSISLLHHTQLRP